MAIEQHRLTLEKFLKLPEEKPALEFLEGTVTQKVAPQGKHSVLQYAIAERINRAMSPDKRAYAFPELRATFAGVSRVPDVAVYRWERIPRDEAGEVANTFSEPPDIAIEIVSPGQSTNALLRRCLWFVANGVAVAILADPEDKSLLVFRPGQSPQPLHGSDRIALDEVLPGFELTVEDLFASLSMT